MEWLNSLLALDRAAFYFVNTTLSNSFFDAVLPWLRERLFWAPLYLFVLAFSWYNFGKRQFLFVVAGIVLSIGAADHISSEWVKKNVKRVRPCNDPALELTVRERVTCGSGYSFTSSHAANHFAAAVFLTGVFGLNRRWVKWAALAWAFSVALAQVYVGVHYPGDVIAGGLLGAIIGGLVFRGLRSRLV